MSLSGAASSVSKPQVLAAVLWLAALACASLGAAQAVPQGTPTVMVDRFEYSVGDTLTVAASGLEPGAAYVVTLTSPDGQASARTVTASPAGALSARSELGEPGPWTVELSGPRIDARLGVRVVGVGPAPGAGPSAPEGDTEVPGEEPASPGVPPEADAPEPAAAPDTEAPGVDEPADAPAAPDAAEPGDALPEPETEREGAEQLPPARQGQGGIVPSEPAVPPAQARAAIEVSIDGDDVVGRRNGVEAWRLSFGSGSGETAGLVQGEASVVVGHGNHLLVVDRLTGTVQRRERLPAQVMDVVEEGAGLSVTLRYSDGSQERLAWPPARPLAFDPDPRVYTWLRAEAGVADPAAQLSRDPTNPWLYVAAARQRPESAETLRRSALSQARTFYEYAQLAQEYMSGPARDETLAAQAMNAALEDFAARGYRSALLFDSDFIDAYGFPHTGLEQALTSGDRDAADFWAPWLYRLTGEGGPAVGDLLDRYSQLLQAEGDDEDAATWRELAAGLRGTDPTSALERAAAAVGSTGWYGVLALLVAIVALRVTLAAKYWRAQTLTLRQSREAGRAPGPLSRALTLRYVTFTEKLVLILLFAAVVAVAALHGWLDRAQDVPDELGSGTLATPVSRALLAEAPDNADKAFALAYAAQTAGDEATAASLYAELERDADALNNLGVLRGDPELFRSALEVDSRHPEALFNLGQGGNPSRLMLAYRPDEPLLASPDYQRLARAFGSTPWAALGAAFTNPFAALVDVRPIETRWLWTAVVVLFLAWVAWTVISLLFPRPQAARNAPRTFLYHLLALLLPGSGLADELWGVVLLVPWAIFGTDLLRHLTYFIGDPAMPFTTDVIALIAIYVVNTVAFVVEFVSYRRRMRDLRVEHPELAAAYGLRP